MSPIGIATMNAVWRAAGFHRDIELVGTSRHEPSGALFVALAVRIDLDEFRRSAPAAYTVLERVHDDAHRAAWQLTGLDRIGPGRIMEHVRR